MLDHDDKPVSGESYSVTLPSGKVVTGWLDSDGWARVDFPAPAGECKVSFPKLDKSEWKPHNTSPLGSRFGG